MDTAFAAEAPEDVGLCSERLARIPTFLNSYLDKKKLPGYALLIARGGHIAHESVHGVMDWETEKPLELDAIFRIYSMTKPITSVALMMLYEEGLFRLEHPVARYIPEFVEMKVWKSGTPDEYETSPAERLITIRDLMTHTSGLTYDFMQQHPVDALYRKNKLFGARTSGVTLQEFVERVASMPLQSQPGTRWNYSVSTDVCGRLVEILSGQTLDEFFEQRIFKPLKMHDTGFWVPEDKQSRLPNCYERNPETHETRLQDLASKSKYLSKPDFLSGGGGLVSTLRDYHRFCQLVLGKGILDGVRLLSPLTVEFMTSNHLPDNQTMRDMGDSTFTEVGFDGTGFGLGFSVLLNPIEAQAPGSRGTFSWGGLASTYFWIDPVEDLIGIFMTQLMPSSSYPIRPQLQQLTYASIIE